MAIYAVNPTPLLDNFAASVFTVFKRYYNMNIIYINCCEDLNKLIIIRSLIASILLEHLVLRISIY